VRYHLLALVNSVMIVSFSVAVLRILTVSEVKMCPHYVGSLFSDFLKGAKLSEC
jgi:hypothetical protein